MTLPLPLGNDMRTGKVYRAQFDFRGDPVGGPIISEGNYIGDVVNIIYGSATSQRVGGRTETVSTEGMIGVQGVSVRSGDRIVVNDETKYLVVGAPLWNYDHYETGTPPSHMWIKVESVA